MVDNGFIAREAVYPYTATGAETRHLSRAAYSPTFKSRRSTVSSHVWDAQLAPPALPCMRVRFTCAAGSAQCKAYSTPRSGAYALSPSPGYQWVPGNNLALMRAVARGPLVGRLTACLGHASDGRAAQLQQLQTVLADFLAVTAMRCPDTRWHGRVWHANGEPGRVWI